MTKHNIPKVITHGNERYYVRKESRIFERYPVGGYGLYRGSTFTGFVSSAGGGRWQAIKMRVYPVGQHPPAGDEFDVLMGTFLTIRDALHAILKYTF